MYYFLKELKMKYFIKCIIIRLINKIRKKSENIEYLKYLNENDKCLQTVRAILGDDIHIIGSGSS